MRGRGQSRAGLAPTPLRIQPLLRDPGPAPRPLSCPHQGPLGSSSSSFSAFITPLYAHTTFSISYFLTLFR